jgi:hypothetical protein
VNESLWRYADKWASRALDHGWVEKWVEGAIFPRELVAFMAVCESRGVTSIVESGRQDAFSTLVLAEYTEEHAGVLVSIDLELDPARDARARKRLTQFRSIRYCRGDASRHIASEIAAVHGPVAVVIDGPKHLPALALNFAAAALPTVAVVAQHNLLSGAPDHRLFSHRAGGPVFYEDWPGTPGPAWTRLGELEREFCSAAGAARSLERSSLGIVDITNRRRLVSTVSPGLRLYQPFVVAALWRCRLFALVPLLFRVSAKAGALVRMVDRRRG